VIDRSGQSPLAKERKMSISMQTKKLGSSTHLFFGIGGIVNGMALNGLSYFLLIFYNQVLGLSPALTGLALAIALAIDAISDPFVGFLSDNWKSRLGRRHPFLYLSAVPVALLFYCVWTPPADLSQLELFLYLTIVTVSLRLALTFFDIPANAMVPDLTKDYDERTHLMTYKVSASWISGLMLSIAMYVVFLVPTPDQPNGLLNQQGYVDAAIIGSVIIFLAVLTTSLGLHRYIPLLKKTDHLVSISPLEFPKQVFKALKVSSLRVLIVASMFAAISSGLSAALWVYIYGYFWEFPTDQVGAILFANLIGAAIAIIVFPRFSSGKDKRRVAIHLSYLLVVFSMLPIALRMFELMPANGTSELFGLLFLHGIIQVGLVVMISSATYSMSTDIVEQARLHTGLQTEAIILSTQTFTAKSATAGGTALAGIVLSMVNFPENAALVGLEPSVTSNLGLAYMLSLGGLSLAAVVPLYFYKLNREHHLAAVSELANRGVEKDT
jgi:glycoside/pentoside/hexuronide:cation symporter, GPH family